MNLSSKEKDFLLAAARDSIRSLFETSQPPSADYSIFPNLKTKAGAFVTLKIDSELRGCIGYVTSYKSLFETVCEAARHAAVQDPRFNPLTREELELIDIEISILSPMKKISNYNEIIIGEHGLLLEEGFNRGLLLPQVASENNFSREQFLDSICMKAGLNGKFWQKKKLNLKVFTAIVFSEERRRDNA